MPKTTDRTYHMLIVEDDPDILMGLEEYFELGPDAVIAEIRRVVGDAPAYVTFDVDGLDPVYAPGTGTPSGLFGMDAHTAMALGTAGFTAALALIRLEENGLSPDLGPIAVTGATGGVGSFAIDLLAAQGFDVVAVSGKRDRRDYLTGLGAARIVDRDALTTRGRPLEKATWGGAVDNAGGAMLAELLRTTVPWGSVASIGLAAGHDLDATVMPFILRGVSLLGISSANCPPARREAVWACLAGRLRPRHLEAIVTATITLDELQGEFERMLAGETHGRTLVRVASP